MNSRKEMLYMEFGKDFFGFIDESEEEEIGIGYGHPDYMIGDEGDEE